jgi:hypothetical protein
MPNSAVQSAEADIRTYGSNLSSLLTGSRGIASARLKFVNGGFVLIAS